MRRSALTFVLILLVAFAAAADKFDDLVEFAQAENFTAFSNFYSRQFNDPDERNEGGYTALQFISGFAAPSYIEHMVSQGADLNARAQQSEDDFFPDNTLSIAAWGGNEELVAWLVEQELNKEFYADALFWAAKEGRADTGEILTAYVDDLDMHNETMTYVGISANWGEPGAAEFVRMMVEKGANLNAGPDFEYQIMHHAAQNENPDLSLYLLSQDVDWDRVTHWGTPPIMFAIEYSLPLTMALIEKGVSLDVTDGYSGMSPLHEAVWQDNAFLVQLLVDAGAPQNARLEQTYTDGAEEYVGTTPIQMARAMGHRDLVRILQGVDRVELPDVSLQMEVELGMNLSFVRAYSDFTLTDFNGNDSRISDYEGSVVVHNLWASWCPPCIWEMPSLQSLQDQFRASGLVVVAEAMYDEREDSLEFIREQDLDFDFYFRPEGETENRRSGSLPSTHIYSRSGLFMGSWQGSREWDTPDMIEYFAMLTSLDS